MISSAQSTHRLQLIKQETDITTLLFPQGKTEDSSKFKCAEFKSELENFVLSFSKQKKMKDLCTSNILL
jgi:hypothetical protein